MLILTLSNNIGTIHALSHNWLSSKHRSARHWMEAVKVTAQCLQRLYVHAVLANREVTIRRKKKSVSVYCFCFLFSLLMLNVVIIALSLSLLSWYIFTVATLILHIFVHVVAHQTAADQSNLEIVPQKYSTALIRCGGKAKFIHLWQVELTANQLQWSQVQPPCCRWGSSSAHPGEAPTPANTALQPLLPR